MRDPGNVVEFDNLHTYFFTDVGTVKAVDGVSFEVPVGKTVGIVGESGCGKSVTSLSLMQLVQRPNGQIVEGAIRLNLGDKAYDVAKMPIDAMRSVRGNVVSMIFQEPMTSLDPLQRIGKQMEEALRIHHKELSREQRRELALQTMAEVGLDEPETVYRKYPHELSGGMIQRVMIGAGIIGQPQILIADEPTTALDVTIQAQIIALLRKINVERGMAILFISHDLSLVRQLCHRVIVMQQGRIVETGVTEEIFQNPCEPYTKALIDAIPKVDLGVPRDGREASHVR
ncbi:MAG: ABC transporter ATP-binding protein [Atopobiaceae bacterium]|nr:ABC transporter ATP-binding protein [Atopobiaceae bacterium]